MDPRSLLVRLDAIAHSLEQSEHALALIGLGSVGLELDRLDSHSDLDFFVLVEAGYKKAYLDSLQWLSNIQPITYQFLNTEDGYKILFEDGIFCEFAVFELPELQHIPFASGRIIWKRAEIPAGVAQPASIAVPRSRHSSSWLLGEVLTNLFVGLNREKRGERLSAMRFIQGYAVDRLVELAGDLEAPQDIPADPFVPERRFERRFPDLAAQASAWLQGYEKNRESALSILNFLEDHFEVNGSIAAAIRELSDPLNE